MTKLVVARCSYYRGVCVLLPCACRIALCVVCIGLVFSRSLLHFSPLSLQSQLQAVGTLQQFQGDDE